MKKTVINIVRRSILLLIVVNIVFSGCSTTDNTVTNSGFDICPV